MQQTTGQRVKNQQKYIANHVHNSDCSDFFNLLTGPELLDVIEAHVPVHRKRLYTLPFGSDPDKIPILLNLCLKNSHFLALE